MNFPRHTSLALAATLASGCVSEPPLRAPKPPEVEVEIEENENGLEVVSKPKDFTGTLAITPNTFAEIRRMCTEVMDEPTYLPIDRATGNYDAGANAARRRSKYEDINNFVEGVNDYFERDDLTIEDIDNLEVPMGIWAEAQTEYTTNIRISPGDQSEFYDGWHWAVSYDLEGESAIEDFPLLHCGVHGIDGVFFSAGASAYYSGAELYVDDGAFEGTWVLHSSSGKELFVNNEGYDCAYEYNCVPAQVALDSYGEEFFDEAGELVGDYRPFGYTPFPQIKKAP